MSAGASTPLRAKACASCGRLIEAGKAYIRHVRQGDAWTEVLLCWRCADATPDGGFRHAS